MFYHFSFIVLSVCYLSLSFAAGCDEFALFFDDVIASGERDKYLERKLPHHVFFKDLDAYITCISDIVGLGKVQDGTVACQNKVFKGFTKKIIADQFDARFVCAYLLSQQYQGNDGRPFDDTVISLLYRAVPNMLLMSLARLKAEYLNDEEQGAIVLYATHMRTIINILDPKQQFTLWRSTIKDDPAMFDEYMALQSIAKKGRIELAKMHEDMHDVLEHSIMIECDIKDVAHEIITASIDQS